MRIISIILCLFWLSAAQAQYTFKLEKQLACTPVKSQDRTGTCWSFATASFLESELIRQGHEAINLSEMFVVRHIYEDKAMNYVLRQGKANFSQGSLAHDLLRMTSRTGIVPEHYYTGRPTGADRHDHSEMEKGLKGFLDGIITSKPLSPTWKIAFRGILDAYLGQIPEQFEYDGKTFTPVSFAQYLGLSMDHYVHITSFSHHPFYERFVLELPDNYSNGSYYNLPLDEFMSAVDYAILEGYSIAWDGDVGEKGFSAKNGIAVLPTEPDRADLFEQPGPEMVVDQTVRQQGFESYNTTDDHLMHLVGIAFDPQGTKYYVLKNSWGKISPHKGYIYMSEAYFKAKTVAISLHRDALPKRSADKLFTTVIID